MGPVQEDLIQFAPPPSGIVLVNHHVYFSTEETERVIFVHGVAFAHYDVSDRAGEAYAMLPLFESGYANQKNIARPFGVSARSLRRCQERLTAGGLAALAQTDGRPSASRSDPPKKRERDRTILHLKAKGFSNRAIAGKLGLDEKAIRKRLHLLGWAPCPEPSFVFPVESGILAEFDTDASGPSQKSTAGSVAKRTGKISNAELEPAMPSRDLNLLDRSMDRLLTAMGSLEDAAPMFAPASSVPRTGVLLAIPSLAASGLLSIARKIYGTIGPAFYGLRTTLVAYVLLALLRMPGQNIKETFQLFPLYFKLNYAYYF